MDRPYPDEQMSNLFGMFNEDLPVDSLIELAEDGDEDAMGKVAIAYLNGDDDAGIEPEACWVLALAYEHGRGVRKHAKRALAYYQKGAELGNLDCLANLGVYYIEGEKVPEDKEKGFRLCLKAAEQGNGVAMRAVGTCYQFGHGVRDDMKKAIYWYEKALEVIDDPELARKVMIFKSLEDSDTDIDDGTK